MKYYLIGALATLLSGGALAQSLLQVDFKVLGTTLNEDINELRLDISATDRNLAVNGVAVLFNGISVPLTGTCFGTASGGAFCNFSADTLSFNLDLAASLNGTLTVKEGDGSVRGSVPVTLLAVR